MTENSHEQLELLKRLARRYLPNLSPALCAQARDQILLLVMERGTWDDSLDMLRVFPREVLVDALREGTACTMSKKSWNFWHLRLRVGEPGNPPPLPPARHSFSDLLDGEVMPGVRAQLAAGHPIYYYFHDLDVEVEERPDGSVWRVSLRGGRVTYLDAEPVCRY